MKLLTKYYIKDLPDIDDVVYGKVKSYTEYGINVYLPEYDVLAYLNFKNASMARRLKRIKKQLKVGTDHFFGVIMVDENKKYVDLDKKYQSNNNDLLLVNHQNYKICLNIVLKFFKISNIDNLDDQTKYMSELIWDVDKKDIYETFEKYRENINNINKNILNIEQKEVFYKCLCESIKEKIYTIRYHIKINSLSINGCDYIKSYLGNIKDTYNTIPYVISAPIYGLDIINVKLNHIDSTKEEFAQYIQSSKCKSIFVQIHSTELIN